MSYGEDHFLLNLKGVRIGLQYLNHIRTPPKSMEFESKKNKKILVIVTGDSDVFATVLR